MNHYTYNLPFNVPYVGAGRETNYSFSVDKYASKISTYTANYTSHGSYSTEKNNYNIGSFTPLDGLVGFRTPSRQHTVELFFETQEQMTKALLLL